MITYLKVRNLAIVEELAIEPGAGLNVLTGETGAGKSLLIDSLEFLRGARGSTEMIRSGAEKMTAEAIFHLPAAAREILDAAGIDAEPAGDGVELIVKREIAANGRGRVLLNGSALSVRELGGAMDAVLEIHGQHESHQRVAGQNYRQLLDEFGAHDALLDATRATHHAWRAAAEQLEEMLGAQRDRALRLDLLRYQVEEISAAKLDPTEEEALRGERSMLAHAREMIEATSGAFALVDDDEDSALAQLARAQHLLQPLAKEIAELEQIAGDLQDVTYRLQDVARTLGQLSENVRHDPARLEEVEDRLVTIERLNKKYGGSVGAVLEHLGRIQDEFERLSDFEANVEKLQRTTDARLDDYRRAAEKLSAARKKAAQKFQAAIQAELNDLAMERTTVRVTVESGNESAEGVDRIDILIAPNRGEEPKAMQRIASGGELSRIQLAIAAALFEASPHAAAATLVFDEIDAGIGGRVAEVVGRKLQELSARNQVVCVTHLPQIAAFGTTHFSVWKEDAAGHTRARIRRLDDEEQRVSEIARMLGGESIPASAVLHARELLENARFKNHRPAERGEGGAQRRVR
ncbi:MAG TPA: DNA repair protein RecN, partial [Thermoanaerobaculia bacterium]|nr:DNA repair protein RecN [Thermoanaerobaculia bacterium]